MKAAVLGGGAAGFFGAISIKEANPEAEVCIFEKSDKILSKVKISGGGRCNVTNALSYIDEFVENYPRGKKELISVFNRFGSRETIDWFEAHDVLLKTEPDNRVFPVSDNSDTIIDCLLNEAEIKNIHIKKKHQAVELRKKGEGFIIIFNNGDKFDFDKILIATGGNAKPESYDWLRKKGHHIIEPVPSLFSFEFALKYFEGLEGLSVQDVDLSTVEKGIFSTRGPIVLTHKGISGPAVLKLSALGAREFKDLSYDFTLFIDWLPEIQWETLINKFKEIRNSNPNKLVMSTSCYNLPNRLWNRIAYLNFITGNQKWNSINNEVINKLVRFVKNYMYDINGKSTNKEEFVTAGGVSLKDVNFKTMESKKFPGIYFAGEVLDIDGVTGGFNFQSAWSTGWIAGMSIGS